MSTPPDLAPKHLPRVLSKADAAAYCGLTEAGFDHWIQIGKLPKVMKGTRRWDKVAIDQAIDLMSGVSRDTPPPKPDPLETWIEKRAARKAKEAAAKAEADAKGVSPQRKRGR